MDVKLTTDVLKEALNLYPKPEIFNSDQGLQYTTQAHINILKKHGIKISMHPKRVFVAIMSSFVKTT